MENGDLKDQVTVSYVNSNVSILEVPKCRYNFKTDTRQGVPVEYVPQIAAQATV